MAMESAGDLSVCHVAARSVAVFIIEACKSLLLHADLL